WEGAVRCARVGVAAQGEERRDLGARGQGRALVEDLRMAVDGAGQQDVELAELDRVEEPVERGADRHAAGAGIGEVLLPAGARVGVVEFLPLPAGRPADDHVVVLRLAEVDPRLVYMHLTPRWEGALLVLRRAA